MSPKMRAGGDDFFYGFLAGCLRAHRTVGESRSMLQRRLYSNAVLQASRAEKGMIWNGKRGERRPLVDLDVGAGIRVIAVEPRVIGVSACRGC